MQDVADPEVEISELRRVELWRFDELCRAGYDSESADVLSIRLDINLHDAIGLIQDGCSPMTAIRILL